MIFLPKSKSRYRLDQWIFLLRCMYKPIVWNTSIKQHDMLSLIIYHGVQPAASTCFSWWEKTKHTRMYHKSDRKWYATLHI